MLLCKILAYTIRIKIYKKSLTKTINSKHQLPPERINLNYLTDHICTRYSRIFWVYHQKPVTHNLLIRIYVIKNIYIYAIFKIENRITFKDKTGYYLELLIYNTTKLLGRTKNKINEGENGGNVPHLEITEIELVHCNIVNMSLVYICSQYIVWLIARYFS